MQPSADQTRQADAEKSDFPDWPVTDTPPPYPTITVRFAGLMGICYRPLGGSSGVAEIGFNPGDGEHQVDVQVWENEVKIYPSDSLPTIRTMRFGIEDKPASVYFLKLSPDPFNRQTGDPSDFRWMLDLEGEHFYPEKPDKDRDFNFSAILTVMHGTFFTADLTDREFDRVTVFLGTFGTEHESLYRMLLEIDAAIELAETEVAFLEINGQTVQRLTADKKYEVRFSNACRKKNGKLCKYSPKHPLERERSDFHFHRDIFDLPTFRKRYGLMLVGPDNQDTDSDADEKWERRRGTDRAPCMAVGYGQTSGFSE